MYNYQCKEKMYHMKHHDYFRKVGLYMVKEIKLLTVNEAKERYKLSRNTLIKIAEESNAIRRFGRAVRIDAPLMDKAIEKYC